MIIDLLHNQIVSDTITDGFKRSVEEKLVPALAEIYGDAMQGIQMYEDHLADEFLLDGVFYYPMTVVLQGEQVTHWVSWPVDADNYTDLIPYAYVGQGEISFDLSPLVPIDFETAIVGRSRYCEDGLIKISVRSTSPSPTFLAGKYSQTFIDEMARQLTVQIEEKMSVEGLAESGLGLTLEFAPVTFMEHNSENVTYRRLLFTDGASAPRDFWVKWINHRADTPFTVSDHPLSDEIEFLIGEGVHQKIREREYRHLVRTNIDKYQSAMGKRNITEWRDLIKRAIKRGKLTQIIRQIPLAEEVIMVNAALASEAGLSTADVVSASISYEDESRNMDIAAELAKAAGIAVDQYIDDPDDEVNFTEAPSSTGIEDELLALIAHNKETIANRDNLDDEICLGEEKLDEVEKIEEIDEVEEFEEEIEEIYDEEYEEESDEEFEVEVEVEIDDENEDEFEEQLEIELVDLPEEDEEPIVEEATEEPEIEVELEEIEESEPVCEIEEASEEIEEIEENTVIEPKNVVEKADDGDDFIANLEKIKSDISSQITEKIDARIKLEYEKRARSSAEAEIAELRRKHEQLLIENRRLEAQAKKEYEERRRISEERKLENERLRAELEAKAKAEAIEKERLVEAARSAVEERHRLERERLAEERRRIEDERRLAEDRARAEAEARVQAERALEAERIRLAAQAAAATVAEEEAVEEPVNKYAHYTYIAKNVKLLFRYSVDPNITVRIQEIIAATLEHFDKSDLHIRVRATVPDTSSVVLEFLEFPKEEMDLLYEMIKVLGASGIGIAKAILEDPKK